MRGLAGGVPPYIVINCQLPGFAFTFHVAHLLRYDPANPLWGQSVQDGPGYRFDWFVKV